MKTIDEVLFLEFGEMLEAGISENTLKQAKKCDYKSWHFMDDPADNRRVLIGYEKLKPAYKEQVKKRFGDPYAYAAKNPLRDMVEPDHAAEAWFMAHRYRGTDGYDKALPMPVVAKYTRQAAWLNMLLAVKRDERLVKKGLKLTMEAFYNQVQELNKHDGLELPTSYRRLLAKRDEYEAGGYAALVSWKFGNTQAAKVSDEVAEAKLLEMLADGNQHDDAFVCAKYNRWAADNGYRNVDASTVGIWRRKREMHIIMQREGSAALNAKYIQQAKGMRPSRPLYMVESDDNHLDLLFEDAATGNRYARYKAIVVMDSYNDYVLGYAYATELSIELVRAAYANAMYHIKELTGGWHLPHEIKTDRWALATLRPFYSAIGHYMDSPVLSKHRGYIEQFFGHVHWKRCLKAGANNYTGNNMTATHRGVNVEAVAANARNRPLLGRESETQVEAFFHNLRHFSLKEDQPSRQQKWLQAWSLMDAAQKRPVSDEQFLLKFGITHNPGNPIQISNRGVEPQIQGVKYSYDLDVAHLREYIGKPVQVVYDPYDMSRVLLTDGQSLRIMARSAQLHSRALADATEGSRAFLNATLGEKRDTVKYVADASDRRKQILTSLGTDAESLLTGGMVLKGPKQQAEQDFQRQYIELQQPQPPRKTGNPYLDQM